MKRPMRILLILLLMSVAFKESYAQLSPSSNQNYIITFTPRDTFSNASVLSSQSASQVMVNIQYFDGLSRPIQNVMVKGSPTFKDVVQPMQYDAFGREATKYLPYAEQSSDNGSYKTASFTNQSNYYNSGSSWDGHIVKTPNPYNQTQFEASPLNRVQEQGAPGADWQLAAGHTQKLQYGSNNTDQAYTTTGFAVRLYQAQIVTTSGEEHKRTLVQQGTGFYPANELYVTISKDENWQSTDGKAGTIEEYKDKEGRIILKRTFNYKNSAIETLSTYYVYDDLGNFSFVLPPGANPDGSTPDQTALDNFCYQYRYDGKRRLIEKKIPGKGWEEMVYNKLNQMIFSQDAVQRNNSERAFMKYDGLGRVIMTGIETGQTITRAQLQSIVDQSTAPLWEVVDNAHSWGYGYSQNAIPQNLLNMKVMTINYYDDYSNPGAFLVTASVSASNMTKGLLTSTRIYQTDGTNALMNAMYYDAKGRLIEQVSQNHLSGLDRTINTYNFIGELQSSTRSHTGTQSVTIVNGFTYDHMGRRLATTSNINSAGAITLSSNTYNEIGQLKSKAIHNNLNTTFYSYNERGWMKSQSNSVAPFSMALKYNDGTNPQYNGNIGQQIWEPVSNTILHTYTYSYDKLNRLLSGTSDEGKDEVLTYDVMGNISTLNRNSVGASTYYYINGNRLDYISGSTLNTGIYQYDVNGNATYDGRASLYFTYNYLNLVNTFHNGSQTVTNTWLADGTKIKKTSPAGTRDYVSGIEYNNSAIEFVQTEEGRAFPNGGSYVYEYMIKDHLGNTRVLLHQNGTPSESTDYYPFGKEIFRSSPSSPQNNYKYNGKELQQELGLNQYDYGARFYDAEIGRWNVIDPLAGTYENVAPYNYVINNPILNIDPDGRRVEESTNIASTEVKRNEDGTYTVTGGKEDQDRNIYVVNEKGDRTGEIIGQSKTPNSFLDHNGNPVVGAILNPKSNEGQRFVDGIENKDPWLMTYLYNATGKQPYDFKTKGKRIKGQTDIQHYYRGSIDNNGDYGSARDFGNYAAGLVAARSGLSWKQARFGFDTLEGWQQNGITIENNGFGGPFIGVKPVREGNVTIMAQILGYIYGIQKYGK